MVGDAEWQWVTESVAGDWNHVVLAASLPLLLPYGIHGLEAWNEAVCGGARNKVLEFFARGKAVISTKEGMRGVENAKSGEHYLHAETPKEFYDALLLLRDDLDLRLRLGRAARWIAKDYLWSSAARRLLGIFQSVV